MASSTAARSPPTRSTPSPGGGYGGIDNFGSITGFIKVFGLGNEFVFNNEKGGVFEARQTSIFGGCGFFNQEGAHAAGDPYRS